MWYWKILFCTKTLKDWQKLDLNIHLYHKLILALNFGEGVPFNESNEDWILSDMRFDRIATYHVNNAENILVFERN